MSAADHEAAIREEADFITSISWPSSGIPAGCDKIKEHAAALVGLLQQAKQRLEQAEHFLYASDNSLYAAKEDAVARAEQAEQERARLKEALRECRYISATHDPNENVAYKVAQVVKKALAAAAPPEEVV
jgi:hypothetical protein